MSVGKFLLVFGLGFVVAAFLGFVAQQILLARDQKGAYRRPQRVVMETKLTPLQVLRNSIAAGCRYFFWLVVLVLGLSFLVWLILKLFPAL
jgi:hypothetical protein